MNFVLAHLALTSEFVALLNKDFRKSAAPVFDATKLPGVRARLRYAIVAVDSSRAMGPWSRQMALARND